MPAAQVYIGVYISIVLFEGIDSSLSDNFGRTVVYGLSSITTLITVATVGGLPFVAAAALIGLVYYNGKTQVFLPWTRII